MQHTDSARLDAHRILFGQRDVAERREGRQGGEQLIVILFIDLLQAGQLQVRQLRHARHMRQERSRARSAVLGIQAQLQSFQLRHRRSGAKHVLGDGDLQVVTAQREPAQLRLRGQGGCKRGAARCAQGQVVDCKRMQLQRPPFVAGSAARESAAALTRAPHVSEGWQGTDSSVRRGQPWPRLSGGNGIIRVCAGTCGYFAVPNAAVSTAVPSEGARSGRAG